MKKLLIAMAVTMLFSTAAYAQGIDLNGDVSAGRKIEVTGLEDGYYDLTVTCKNTATDENTYLYGISEGYTMSSTVLPKSEEGVKVTVKGIGVSGGKCEVGVVTDGNSVIEFSDADLTASQKSKFIIGGDMTEVSYIESLGGVYKDEDGNPVDVFEYLSDNGVNMARIRLSNTTGKGTGDGAYYLPGGFQDEEDCLELARRAKDAGMGIQFTFNYSDYWSNGERQIIPSEWVKQIKDTLGYDIKDPAFLNGMTAETKKEIQDKLGDILYEYTKDIMTKLKNQGTLPEYVSLGNEINGGMFFPFANTFDAAMDKDSFELIYSDIDEDDILCYKDWEGLANILNRGYDAIKEVSPQSQVVIHLANGSKDSIFTWFFDEYIKAGGKFDVIGASYYPAWSHNPIESCVDFCNNISKLYDKDILIMETGYNWTENKKNGYGGQLTPTAEDEKNAPGYTEKYPFTTEGHKSFMIDLINSLKGVDGGRCAGLLYWDPCMIHVEDPENPNESLSGWANRESDDLPDGNVVENTTLFDFDGKAIPSVKVFRNSKNSMKAKLSADIISEEESNTVAVAVENGLTEKKTISLIAVLYDENGMMTGTVNASKEVKPQTDGLLTVSVPPSAKSVLYLWNGETLSRISK